MAFSYLWSPQNLPLTHPLPSPCTPKRKRTMYSTEKGNIKKGKVLASGNIEKKTEFPGQEQKEVPPW